MTRAVVPSLSSSRRGHDCWCRRSLGDPYHGWIGHIGTLNEGSLHAALKAHWRRPGDRLEVEIDGYVVDIARADELVEIQTGSFAALGPKLDALLGSHRMTVVHPIASTIVLERPGMADRRSPRRGHLHHVLDELVSVPTLLDHPHFSLEVVMVEERRLKVHDPTLRRRRGGWRTVDRRLEAIVACHRFDLPTDLLAFVPAGLPPEFGTADLAAAATYGRDTAQKLAYCLRSLGLLVVVGRGRDGYRYRLAGPAA